jgi:hypothetical protein
MGDRLCVPGWWASRHRTLPPTANANLGLVLLLTLRPDTKAVVVLVQGLNPMRQMATDTRVLFTQSFEILREDNDLNAVRREKLRLDPSRLKARVDGNQHQPIVRAPRRDLLVWNIALSDDLGGVFRMDSDVSDWPDKRERIRHLVAQVGVEAKLSFVRRQMRGRPLLL